jgi:hypothetical protein
MNQLSAKAGTSLPFERSPAYDENDVSDKPSYIQEMPLIDAAGDLANEVEFRQRRECLMAVDEMVKVKWTRFLGPTA